MLHDPLGVAGEISEGMALWGNRFFGPSSIAQAALPAILNTSEEWHNEVIEKVKVRHTIGIHLSELYTDSHVDQRAHHREWDQVDPRFIVHHPARSPVHARQNRLLGIPALGRRCRLLHRLVQRPSGVCPTWNVLRRLGIRQSGHCVASGDHGGGGGATERVLPNPR